MKVENIPTSDYDLLAMTIELKIKFYDGAYLKDRLPKKIKKDHHIIVNLDSSEGTGTHWVCLSNMKKDGYLSYFDSFGLQPPQEVVRLSMIMKKKIMYNTTQYQETTSNLCGPFCVYMISERSLGKSFYDTVYQIGNNKTDRFIKTYFEKL